MTAVDPSFLSGVFGITTLIAAGLAGLSWGVVRTLRETARDLRDRVGDLEDARESDKREREAEQVKHQAELTQLKRRQTELSAENATLAKLVTGEVHWVALTHLLEEHHTEASAHWRWLKGVVEGWQQEEEPAEPAEPEEQQ